ncbi:MAG: hypothetical protein A3J53_00715 [Candidatus Harrisonbacteria bacterium RIFCSPHIGHO2_02_FULL_40_20]|nr:MAG: hypothetical protein A3J53_00715 [Candidatus Harrisonbacteria bacterium RIFCSPHIGHO2_02_FULL_40_20]
MDFVKELEQKLKAIVDSFKQELFGIRANRPSAKLVEDIRVDYTGQSLMIKQLGSISIVPPKEIDINVWDSSAVASVAKALESSKLGLSANIDGNLIRINLPSLTQERRDELAKLVKSIAEQNRIKIRAGRDDANKKIEQIFKEKKISEDQKFKDRKKIQEAVDKVNNGIEALLADKIKEINE